MPWNFSGSTASLSRRGQLVHEDLVDVLNSDGWEDGKKIADSCYEAQNKTGAFLSSAFVARDMLQIVDALNEDGKLRYWGMLKAYYSGPGLTHQVHLMALSLALLLQPCSLIEWIECCWTRTSIHLITWRASTVPPLLSPTC